MQLYLVGSQPNGCTIVRRFTLFSDTPSPTLVVRKRLDPTAGMRSTRSSAAAGVVLSGKESVKVGSTLRSNLHHTNRRQHAG